MRRPLAALLSLPVLFGSACSAEDDPGLADVDCRTDVVEPLGALADRGVSGAVVVSAPGLDCATGFGPAGEDGDPVTPQTVFAIGSVTKLMTAAAVVGLAEEGRLDLDDPVGSHVPSLPPEVAAVTLEQLLAHTGGLGTTHGTDEDPLSRHAAVRAIADQGLLFEPGTEYAYSNSGYTMLAAVVEEVTGSYRRHLVDEVLTVSDGQLLGGFWDGDLQAVGPRATGYSEDGSVIGTGGSSGEFWGLEGNGGAAMSATQLHDWVRALGDGDVVPAEGLQRMTAPAVEVDDGTAEALGFAVLDDAVPGTRALVAAGGGGTGHNVVVVWLPEPDLVAVVATNRAEVTAEDLARPLVTALLAGDPVPAPVVGVDVADEVLTALRGRYELDDGSALIVGAAEGALEVTASGGDALPALYPPPGDGVDADGGARHQDLVEAFLAGDTDAGREELELLRADIGDVTATEVTGTAFVGGEFRTYIEVTGATGSLQGWLALDDRGQLSAVDYSGPSPSRRLVLTETGQWVPATAGGRDGTLAVAFDDPGTMTVTTPAGAVTATRTG